MNVLNVTGEVWRKRVKKSQGNSKDEHDLLDEMCMNITVYWGEDELFVGYCVCTNFRVFE